jgi:hypothetical protein
MSDCKVCGSTKLLLTQFEIELELAGVFAEQRERAVRHGSPLHNFVEETLRHNRRHVFSSDEVVREAKKS